MPLSLDGTTGISASGNITAAYLFGNASGLSGISSNKIFNGTSEANIGTSGGNANVSIGGTANVAVFTTGGLTVTGLTATGNSTLGNLTITGSRTIDVGNNRISNLAEPSAGTDAATKDYVDSVSSSGFTIEDDTANTTVVSGGDTLELFGTANEVEVAVTATDRVTVSLPANVTVPNNLSVTGNVTTTGTVNTGPLLVTGNVSVTGNIAVTGNINYSNVTDLVVGDPLIFLGANNTGNIYDLGFIVTYDDGLDQHGGWVRDATDGTWKLFGNVVAEPTTTVDFTNAIYQPMRAGNVTAGNVLSSGVVSATGNVTGSYILGNGSQLSGIITSVANINNGTTILEVVSSGGNIRANVGGTANVAVLATTGLYVTGVVSASGNVAAGNLTTSGQVSATGNITGGNLITGGGTGGNITGANVITATTLSSTGNTVAGNLTTAGVVSATGNITANYFIGNGSQLTGISSYGNANVVANLAALSSNPVSTTGNVTAGNLLTSGLVSATGNITGANIIAGAGTGGNITGANVITANTISSTGNITIAGGTGGNLTGANVISATTFTASGNITANYFIGNGSQLTGLPASYGNANVVANLAALSSNPVSTTGNITAGNLLTSGILSATGNITGANIIAGAGTGGNITGANVITANSISSTGNITISSGSGGNLTGANVVSANTLSVGNIINSNANGVGNIGNSTTYFNTVFAKATSAQYADLAENYLADAAYEPGTVVIFGGLAEVTQSIAGDDHRVAGVVSTRPSHLMNAGLTGDHVVALALQGRVPCRVAGLVARGDLLVSAADGRARANNQARAGTIIGKALQDSAGADGVIEIAVGRD